MSSNELSDYSVCVALLVRGETVYVLEVKRERLEYPELKRTVSLDHRRWRQIAPAYSLLIEKKGAGLSLIQDLRRENIHAIGVEPVGDKVLRMSPRHCQAALDRRSLCGN